MTSTVNSPPVVIAAADALTSNDLVAFLTRQRWFAARGGGSAESARVDGIVPLPWGDGALAIARIAVSVEGRPRSYQLPLAARPVAASALPESCVIASPVLAGRHFCVYDAVEDPEFQHGLARVLGAGTSAEGDTLRWVIEPEGSHGPSIPQNAEVRVSSAEQSNTSIVFAGAAILKLFRRLEPGAHPELEMCRFLTAHAKFNNTSTVLATLRFEERSSDGTSLHIATGVVQEYISGATDVWKHAIDRGTPYFAAPRGVEPRNEFVIDAEQLGNVTREMHDALASQEADREFAPEKATADELDRWAHRAQQAVREGLSLLEKQLSQGALPAERRAEAAILVKRRENYLAWVNELADRVGDDLGACIRVHGDYHLGQVLRAPTGHFIVIDFEGEPTRPLAERREKSSPLRDVAGMLRSFAYAAATLGISIEKTVDMATRELRIGRWERDARAAFLAGYLRDTDGASELLPEDSAHVQDLIALFETEKVFYELAYELSHRADWAWIPMRGISKLLVGQEDKRTG